MIFHDEAQVDTHAQYLKSRAGIALNETFPTKIEELKANRVRSQLLDSCLNAID